MVNTPDDPNQAQAWISGTPPDQTIDFYIPRGNTGPRGPVGPIGPSLAVGSVATVTGPAAPGTVGPQGLTGPKGDPGGFTIGTSLNAADLNTIRAPGLYVQTNGGNTTLANNYPKTLSVPVHMEVFAATSDNERITQELTFVSSDVNVGSRMKYSRTYYAGVWQPWRVYNSTRVDVSAGRAIYQWDDVNGRDQMIYGDTGWRDLTPLVGAAAWLRTRRMGNTVWLWGAAINLSAVAPSEVMYVLPAGFRTGSNSINALIGRDGTAFCIFEVNLNGNLKAPFTGSTPRTTDYYFMISFPTSESWPTTLPGTASGFIPNL
ncbi:hypothetical protein SEA_TEACUP_22 [Arthrobacter phage Teacup]|uniref:Minor tail protein n=1 Tax=Arthrobacter phage Teacup TaxID=2015871 RepID=A0A222ZHU9_9CAUD|nr:hypothetical protein QCN31_gp22 [Arthrobacter phage Teacup]ASR84028.1 hypothetical protein SEA_TEACUP_22 [Arthrobacter phage Teacup]